MSTLHDLAISSSCSSTNENLFLCAKKREIHEKFEIKIISHPFKVVSSLCLSFQAELFEFCSGLNSLVVIFVRLRGLSFGSGRNVPRYCVFEAKKPSCLVSSSPFRSPLTNKFPRFVFNHMFDSFIPSS